MKTFFTFLDKQYNTEAEAIADERAMSEAGYNLTGHYIEQYWIDDCGGVVSIKPKAATIEGPQDNPAYSMSMFLNRKNWPHISGDIATSE